MFVVRTMGWMLGKVWRRLFSTVKVDEMNILKAREISMEKPIVLLPSHKSHVDYLMMSYICFAYNFPMPVICAGENLNIFGIGVMLRYAGCFFMKRSFRSLDMAKYRIACKKYVHGVLSLSSNNSDENNSSSKDFNTSNINENEKMEGNKNTTKKLNNSIKNYRPFLESNIIGTINLLNASLKTLINSSRGEIIDEKFISEQNYFDYIADVWIDEPDCDEKLVEKALLSTPHIAGYSNQAKHQGTKSVICEFAKFFGFKNNLLEREKNIKYMLL